MMLILPLYIISRLKFEDSLNRKKIIQKNARYGHGMMAQHLKHLFEKCNTILNIFEKIWLKDQNNSYFLHMRSPLSWNTHFFKIFLHNYQVITFVLRTVGSKRCGLEHYYFCNFV